MKKSKIILNGIINENPTFSLFLGMCPVLITSSSVFSAFGMAICVFFVLFMSNTVISLLKHLVPNEIRVPVYILIIATIVSLVDMLVHAFIPSVYMSIGAYISMIVVNCIILGRAESFASKNSVVDSMLDAIGISAGFLVAVISVSFFRELLGTGGITFVDFFNNENTFTLKIIPDDYVISFFQSSAGAFFSLGIAVALISFIKNIKENKKKEKLALQKANQEALSSKEA